MIILMIWNVSQRIIAGFNNYFILLFCNYIRWIWYILRVHIIGPKKIFTLLFWRMKCFHWRNTPLFAINLYLFVYYHIILFPEWTQGIYDGYSWGGIFRNQYSSTIGSPGWDGFKKNHQQGNQFQLRDVEPKNITTSKKIWKFYIGEGYVWTKCELTVVAWKR